MAINPPVTSSTAPLPVLPGMPDYLSTSQNSTLILQAILAAVSSSFDVAQGSFIWDFTSPVAVQLAQAAVWVQQALLRSFAMTTFGAYLDNRAAEHGVFRLAATPATGFVTFTGASGTVIPSGTQISTAGGIPPVGVVITSPQLFVTTGGTIQSPLTSITLPVTAVVPGLKGNVSAGTIIFPTPVITGITGVTNTAPTTGGSDTELDADFLFRYLNYVRNPPAGGNIADYYNWAIVVPGVGAVSVAPLWNGNGTVGVYLLDTNKAPASQLLIDTVQNIIAPPVSVITETKLYTFGGTAPATDLTQMDALSQPTTKFTYVGGSYGRLTSATFQAGLAVVPQYGLYTIRLRAKVSSITGTTPLLSVGVWNNGTQAWASGAIVARLPTDPGYVSSRLVFAANTFAANNIFQSLVIPFGWTTPTDTLQVVVAADFVLVNNPTVATSLAHSAAATGLLAGVYTCGYTYENGLGETPVGTTSATVTISAGDKITWTPPAMPAGCHRINLYVSIPGGAIGTARYAKSATTTTPVDVTALPLPSSPVAPLVSTALAGDSSTLLWIDQSKFVSTFSSTLTTGKAPIGASVTVQTPTSVVINVAATLTLAAGTNVATAQAACTAAVVAYLQSIALSLDPTVRWSHVAAAVSGVTGVNDFSSLTINGGTANITIPSSSVAVLGTASWS